MLVHTQTQPSVCPSVCPQRSFYGLANRTVALTTGLPCTICVSVLPIITPCVPGSWIQAASPRLPCSPSHLQHSLQMYNSVQLTCKTLTQFVCLHLNRSFRRSIREGAKSLIAQVNSLNLIRCQNHLKVVKEEQRLSVPGP